MVNMHDNKPNHGIKETIFAFSNETNGLRIVLDDLPSCCKMLDKRAGFSKKVQMHVLVSIYDNPMKNKKIMKLFIYI